MDRSSSSLSLAGPEVAADIMDPNHVENVLLLEYSYSITQEERIDIRKKVQDTNPGASKGERKIIYRDALLKAALEAQKKKSQDAKDSSLSSPLKGMDNEQEFLVRGPAQRALLDEFRLSLTFIRKSGRQIQMQTQWNLLRTFVQQR
jgi:hypothetical protein